MTLVIKKPTSGKLVMAKNSLATWAQGGDVTYTINVSGVTYMVHEFRTVGFHTLNVLKGGTLEYLVVAGGGGGSTAGGGAGGLIEGIASFPTGFVNVVVGAGGTGIAGSATPRPRPAQKGQNSILGELIAIGGGGGSGTDFGNSDGGASGGSGGGGGSSSTPNAYVSVSTGALQPTSASGGFGYPGGDVTDFSPNTYTAGGGGGAGSPGANGIKGAGGNGGAGRISAITGNNIYYAGGGGGGIWNGGAALGLGGVGGGGNAGSFSGAPNTGGGGGGGASNLATGGSGGSGIVIVRYAL